MDVALAFRFEPVLVDVVEDAVASLSSPVLSLSLLDDCCCWAAGRMPSDSSLCETFFDGFLDLGFDVCWASELEDSSSLESSMRSLLRLVATGILRDVL